MTGKLVAQKNCIGVEGDDQKTISILAQDKPLEVRDSDVRGLIYRMQPSGVSAFYVQFRNVVGKTCRIRIGRYPEIGLPKARERARQEVAKVTLGNDPAAEKRELREAVKSLTLEEFLDLHYKPWAEANLKSYSPTMARLKSGFIPLVKKNLSDLTAWDFEKHRQWRLKNKIGKSQKEPGQATINRDQMTLRAALTRAVQWGHLQSNPLDGVKKAREDRNRNIRALEPEEEQRMLEALAKPRDKWETAYKRLETMLILSLDTGMRQGEVFGLEWRDLDFDGRMVTVRGEGAKSSQSRTIPLSQRCVGALNAWGAYSAAEGLVFPGESGARLNNVEKAWRKILQEAKVSNLRWHDLRHSFGSRLALAGVPLPVIQKLMGHAAVSTTSRYLHATDQDARRAIQALTGNPSNVVEIPKEHAG